MSHLLGSGGTLVRVTQGCMASVPVPSGWVREVSSIGEVSYTSPDNTRLKSCSEVEAYFRRDDTCKCGLRCPFRTQDYFNFESAVIGLEESLSCELHHSCHVFSDMRRNFMYEDVPVDGISDEEVEPTGPGCRMLVTTSTGAGEDLLVFDTIVQTDEFTDEMDGQENLWIGDASDIASTTIVSDKADIGADSMPYSAIMGSLSHAKVVNLLKSVDRCFQLLEPEYVAALEPSSESDLLIQCRKMSRALEYPQAADLLDMAESDSSVLVDRTNSKVQGDALSKAISISNNIIDCDSLLQLKGTENARSNGGTLCVPPSLAMLAAVSCFASPQGIDHSVSKKFPDVFYTPEFRDGLAKAGYSLPLPAYSPSLAENGTPEPSGWDGLLSPPHSGISDPCGGPVIPSPPQPEAITPSSPEPSSAGSSHFLFTDESIQSMTGSGCGGSDSLSSKATDSQGPADSAAGMKTTPTGSSNVSDSLDRNAISADLTSSSAKSCESPLTIETNSSDIVKKTAEIIMERASHTGSVTSSNSNTETNHYGGTKKNSVKHGTIFPMGLTQPSLVIVKSYSGINTEPINEAKPTSVTQASSIADKSTSRAVTRAESECTMSLRRRSRRVKSTPIKSWTTDGSKLLIPSAAAGSVTGTLANTSNSTEGKSPKKLCSNGGHRGKNARRGGKKNSNNKSSGKNGSRGRDVVIKTFHIPLVDCGSNSPPNGPRLRRHTFCHDQLANVRNEAKECDVSPPPDDDSVFSSSVEEKLHSSLNDVSIPAVPSCLKAPDSSPVQVKLPPTREDRLDPHDFKLESEDLLLTRVNSEADSTAERVSAVENKSHSQLPKEGVYISANLSSPNIKIERVSDSVAVGNKGHLSTGDVSDSQVQPVSMLESDDTLSSQPNAEAKFAAKVVCDSAAIGDKISLSKDDKVVSSVSENDVMLPSSHNGDKSAAEIKSKVDGVDMRSECDVTESMDKGVTHVSQKTNSDKEETLESTVGVESSTSNISKSAEEAAVVMSTAQASAATITSKSHLTSTLNLSEPIADVFHSGGEDVTCPAEFSLLAFLQSPVVTNLIEFGLHTQDGEKLDQAQSNSLEVCPKSIKIESKESLSEGQPASGKQTKTSKKKSKVSKKKKKKAPQKEKTGASESAVREESKSSETGQDGKDQTQASDQQDFSNLKEKDDGKSGVYQDSAASGKVEHLQDQNRPLDEQDSYDLSGEKADGVSAMEDDYRGNGTVQQQEDQERTPDQRGNFHLKKNGSDDRPSAGQYSGSSGAEKKSADQKDLENFSDEGDSGKSRTAQKTGDTDSDTLLKGQEESDPGLYGSFNLEVKRKEDKAASGDGSTVELLNDQKGSSHQQDLCDLNESKDKLESGCSGLEQRRKGRKRPAVFSNSKKKKKGGRKLPVDQDSAGSRTGKMHLDQKVSSDLKSEKNSNESSMDQDSGINETVDRVKDLEKSLHQKDSSALKDKKDSNASPVVQDCSSCETSQPSRSEKQAPDQQRSSGGMDRKDDETDHQVEERRTLLDLLMASDSNIVERDSKFFGDGDSEDQKAVANLEDREKQPDQLIFSDSKASKDKSSFDQGSRTDNAGQHERHIIGVLDQQDSSNLSEKIENNTSATSKESGVNKTDQRDLSEIKGGNDGSKYSLSQDSGSNGAGQQSKGAGQQSKGAGQQSKGAGQQSNGVGQQSNGAGQQSKGRKRPASRQTGSHSKKKKKKGGSKSVINQESGSSKSGKIHPNGLESSELKERKDHDESSVSQDFGISETVNQFKAGQKCQLNGQDSSHLKDMKDGNFPCIDQESKTSETNHFEDSLKTSSGQQHSSELKEEADKTRQWRVDNRRKLPSWILKSPNWKEIKGDKKSSFGGNSGGNDTDEPLEDQIRLLDEQSSTTTCGTSMTEQNYKGRRLIRHVKGRKRPFDWQDPSDLVGKKYNINSSNILKRGDGGTEQLHKGRAGVRGGKSLSGLKKKKKNAKSLADQDSIVITPEQRYPVSQDVLKLEEGKGDSQSSLDRVSESGDSGQSKEMIGGEKLTIDQGSGSIKRVEDRSLCDSRNLPDLKKESLSKKSAIIRDSRGGVASKRHGNNCDQQNPSDLKEMKDVDKSAIKNSTNGKSVEELPNQLDFTDIKEKKDCNAPTVNQDSGGSRATQQPKGQKKGKKSKGKSTKISKTSRAGKSAPGQRNTANLKGKKDDKKSSIDPKFGASQTDQPVDDQRRFPSQQESCDQKEERGDSKSAIDQGSVACEERGDSESAIDQGSVASETNHHLKDEERPSSQQDSEDIRKDEDFHESDLGSSETLQQPKGKKQPNQQDFLDSKEKGDNISSSADRDSVCNESGYQQRIPQKPPNPNQQDSSNDLNESKDDNKPVPRQTAGSSRTPRQLKSRKRPSDQQEASGVNQPKKSKVTPVLQQRSTETPERDESRKRPRQLPMKSYPIRSRDVSEEPERKKKKKVSMETEVCIIPVVKQPKQKKSPMMVASPSFSTGHEEVEALLWKVEEKMQPECHDLVVSIPLFMGRKRMIHHTLLKCTGGATVVETPDETKPPSAEIGDIVWARAAHLQAWPGRVVHHSKKNMAVPPPDKVWVEWYGESTVSLVGHKNITSLTEAVKHRLKSKRPFMRQLKDAIIAALQDTLAARDVQDSLAGKDLQDTKANEDLQDNLPNKNLQDHLPSKNLQDNVPNRDLQDNLPNQDVQDIQSSKDRKKEKP